MSERLIDFYQFNQDFCVSMKQLAYDSYLQSSDYNNDFTNITTTSLDTIYNNLAVKIFTQNNTPTTTTSISAICYKNEIRTQITQSDGTKTKLVLVPSDFTGFGLVPSDFRLVFSIDDDQNLTENYYFNPDYLNSSISISSMLPFQEWVSILPSLVLNICKRNLTEPFYYNLVGYQGIIDNNMSFTPPPYEFNTQYNDSVIIACSLRLVNSKYNGPCLSLYNITDNKYNDVFFDKNALMISYQSIINATGSTVLLLETSSFYIQTIYNQVGTKNFSNNSDKEQPTLNFNKTNGVLIPYIKWTKNSYMTMTSYVTIDPTKIVNPYFTLFSSIGLFDSQDNSTKYNDTNCTDISSDLTINCVGVDKYNNIDLFKSDRFYNGIDNNGNYIIITPAETNNSNKLNNPCNLQKFNNFKTYNSTYVNTSLSMSEIRKDDITTPKYKQTSVSLTNTTTTVNYLPNDNTLKWFSECNSKNECFSSVIMSEMILFVTDGVNISADVINGLSKDNYNVWGGISNLQGIDKRCDYLVPNACELDVTNPICACYPSFTDKTSVYVDNFINNIDKTGLTNSDKWCINPQCASSIAYKNNLSKKATTCSSMCSSTLNINPQKFGKIDINDTQLFTNCTNKSYIINTDSPIECDCKDNESCTIDKNNKKTCVPKVSCNLICNQGFQCVIANDGTQSCVSMRNSTSKCTSDLDCEVGQNCDTNLGICIQNKPNLLLPTIGIFFGVAIVGIIVFFIYKKIRKIPLDILSYGNIKIYIIIIIIALISCLLFYFTRKKYESYEKITKCNTDENCNINSNVNSICITNQCNCIIGYNKPSCTLLKNAICTSISYLPHSTNAGLYYYTTVINNVIYAFSNYSNFKFDGNKWNELSRINSATISQQGFNPFNIKSIPYFPDINNKRLTGLNSNMCCTYNNIVYIFVPDYTFLNIQDHIKPNKSFLLSYDPSIDNITTDVPNSWSIITLDKYPNISLWYTSNNTYMYNNVITCLVGDSLYIFGGYDPANDRINNNIGVYNLSTSTLNNPIVSTNTNYYNYYAKAFASKLDSNIIYILGMGTNSNFSDSGLYKYNISRNQFNMIQTSPIKNPDTSSVFLGGVLSYYSIDKTGEFILVYFSNQYGKGSTQGIKLNLNTSQQTPPSTPYYIDSTGVKNNNVIYSLYYNIFSSTCTKPPTYQPFISSISCYFEMNSFLFLVSADGCIYRLTDYTNTNTVTSTIVPCYGICLHTPPKYNKVLYNIPIGYTWSDKYNAFYLSQPPKTDIATTCYRALPFGCRNQCDSGSIGTRCDQTDPDDSDCLTLEYINTNVIGSGCGGLWTANAKGYCNYAGKSYELAKCRVSCTPPQPSINDQNIPYIFCNRGDDGKKPYWESTNSPDTNYIFYRNTINSDNENYSDCRYSQAIDGTKQNQVENTYCDPPLY